MSNQQENDMCPLCEHEFHNSELAALREENARFREALEHFASPPLTSVSDESYSSYDEGFDDGLLWAKDKADAALAPARPTNAQKRGETIDWEAVGIEFDEFARKSFINLPGEHYELKAAQEAGRMMMHLVRRAFHAFKPAEERGPEVKV